MKSHLISEALFRISSENKSTYEPILIAFWLTANQSSVTPLKIEKGKGLLLLKSLFAVRKKRKSVF